MSRLPPATRSKPIKPGERSERVRLLERSLKRVGYTQVGKIKDVFDRTTTRAWRAFEDGHRHQGGVKVDGIVTAAEAKLLSKEASGGVSLGQLRSVMPHLSGDKAARYLPLLNRALAESSINTLPRKAAFLAQVAHESGELKWFEELASGAAYEGRADLGNTQPGDGRRFKGRGPLQITGRNNYTQAAKALDLELVKHPELAATPTVGFRTSAWYWRSRGLNDYADRGDFEGLTRRINGGLRGYDSRLRYYRRALNVLKAD